MPAGDLIQKDYQYEYRGLLFGSGTEFVVERVQGLLGMPDVSVEDIERQGGHGFFPGNPKMRGRTVDIDMYAVGNSQVDTEDKLDLLNGTFQPREQFDAFVFKRPGRAKRVVYARTYKRVFESTYETARGLAEGAVLLAAADPRVYALAVTQTAFTVAAGTSSGQATVTNGGTFPTAPRVVIDGAVTNPVITNQTSGRGVPLQITTGAGDSLEIDFKTHTVRLNGIDNTAAVVRNDRKWWQLLAGANLIQVSRNGTTGTATVTVHHQDAWT